MMNYKIQRQKISDVSSYVQLQRMQTTLLNKSHDMSQFEFINLVVQGDSKEMLGSLIGWKNYDYSYIEVVWVEKEFQKKGMGRKLIEDFIQISKSLNCSAVLCSTHSHSMSADFWKKVGFEIHSQLQLPNTELFYFIKKI